MNSEREWKKVKKGEKRKNNIDNIVEELKMQRHNNYNNRNNRKIIKTTFFPAKIKKSTKRNIALIGIGCNVGNCIRRFKKLYLFLSNHPKIDIIQTSIIYKNPPFGYLDQPDFYNSVLIVKTDFSPYELLNF